MADQDKRVRSDGIACQHCRFSVQDETSDQPTIELRCHRRVGCHGFPKVRYNDWCGEFATGRTVVEAFASLFEK